MRLVISAGLLALVAACLLTAQAPMGLGPGASGTGLIDIFDWYAGTPSGCTAGPRGMCVGGGTGGVLPQGDTYYFTGWLANANQLPITTGLPIVGTFNDGTSKTCSNNMALLQLAEFSWSNRNSRLASTTIRRPRRNAKNTLTPTSGCTACRPIRTTSCRPNSATYSARPNGVSKPSTGSTPEFAGPDCGR